jgi:hypothetical protein
MSLVFRPVGSLTPLLDTLECTLVWDEVAGRAPSPLSGGLPVRLCLLATAWSKSELTIYSTG